MTLNGTRATFTTSGKQAYAAGGAFEVQAAASSFIKTSAGDMELAATGSGRRLYATGVGAVTLGSSADNVFLSAITTDKRVNITADRFEVATSDNSVLVSTTGELRLLLSSAGNSFITAMAGTATILARDSVVSS